MFAPPRPDHKTTANGGIRRRSSVPSVISSSDSKTLTATPNTDDRKRARERDFQSDPDRVRVSVRIRPHNVLADGGDKRRAVWSEIANGVQKVMVKSGKLPQSFPFDNIFDDTATQGEVYSTIGAPLLEDLFNGYNVCLFTYGQTGSGKTYSLLGGDTEATEGVVKKLCRDMMQRISEKLSEIPDFTIKLSMSFLEIYNEKVRDLLGKKPKNEDMASLRIYEQNGKIFVPDLSQHTIINYTQIASLVEKGLANRQISQTQMNEYSSRSHSVLQFRLEQMYEKTPNQGKDLESVLTLVDLAGSERISKTEMEQNSQSAPANSVHLEESRKINQSLLALGTALNYFANTDKPNEKVPFLRTSKLTRLLSDCFWGNSKTWMLATCSPSEYNISETISTLTYASNAKNITNYAKVNRIERSDIAELKLQVQRLN